MIDEDTEEFIGTVLGDTADMTLLTLQDFMTLNAPLVPLIRHDHCLPRVPGVEFSEDVIANIQLIDRIGLLPVTASSSYIYRIRQGSIANSASSNEKFERGYSDYIDRLEQGDGFGLKPENRLIASEGLIAKRALNRAYMDAQTHEPQLGFQEFVKKAVGSRQ
ncbi:MAG: hypothetical protein EBT35_10610 [Alphaproteobacteria bacterium]|nr:hypothetical protein [Alphaproteobacteria bacterium]